MKYAEFGSTADVDALEGVKRFAKGPDQTPARGLRWCAVCARTCVCVWFAFANLVNSGCHQTSDTAVAPASTNSESAPDAEISADDLPGAAAVPEATAETPKAEVAEPGLGGGLAGPTDAPVALPGPDQSSIEAFLEKEGYKDWAKQPANLSGAHVDGTNYAVHGFIEVYYSPGVDKWMTAIPPKANTLPNNEMIVAKEYAVNADGGQGELKRVLSMVRTNGDQDAAPFDGWFWSTAAVTGGKVDKTDSHGSYGASRCLRCHASANNDGLVFLNKNGPLRINSPDLKAWKPDDELIWRGDAPPVKRELAQPLAKADSAFLKHFDLTDVTEVPEDERFPAKRYDHVWAGNHAGASGKEWERFVTSDQCVGCHNAAQLMSSSSPNMWYPEPDPARSLVDGEATPESNNDDAKYGALARDGVSCAVCHQIPVENLGGDPTFVNRTGGKGGFQLPLDLKSYTAMFANPPADKNQSAYWGPYAEGPPPEHKVLSSVMDATIGIPARHGPLKDGDAGNPQIHESRLCGTCHTVLVPALPVGFQLPEGFPFSKEEGGNAFGLPTNTKMSFEQTTYFEWRNSQFENETAPKVAKSITCQGCHMAAHTKPSRIVNFESDRFPPVSGRFGDQAIKVNKQGPIYRHVLLGINFFVFEMYEQFPDLLGTQLHDARVPDKTVNPLKNARDWIENHAKRITAELRITKIRNTDIRDNEVVDGDKYLEVDVEVTNFAGHKFPTGAGFRRAFIRFEVLDDSDKVLWASGRTSSLGVLVGADGNPLKSEETVEPDESQPHHQIITRQDQVQIYETRALNSNQKLQTTVFGIYYEYKDNRIPPLGYAPPTEEDPVTRIRTGAVLVSTQHPPGLEEIPDEVKEKYKEATHHAIQLDDDAEPTSKYAVVYDPDYWLPGQAKNGQDHVRYRVPLAEIPNWTKVRAQLYYQTIPPYYLRDRFETSKDKGDRMPKDRDMNRLIHIASRLNLNDTPAEGWSLAVGRPVEKSKGDAADAPLKYQQTWERLKDHYNYLQLAPSPN